MLVLVHWDLYQVPSWCLSLFFPSMCSQCQLGVFNQPWSLVVSAPHGVFAWDLCWASPAPQHHLRLWKLQRVRVFSAKLRCKTRGVNCRWQRKAAKHTTLCHHSFLTSGGHWGRSVLGSLATQSWNLKWMGLLLWYNNNFLMIKTNYKKSNNPPLDSMLTIRRKLVPCQSHRSFLLSQKKHHSKLYLHPQTHTHLESQYWVTLKHILCTSADGDGC